MANKAESDDAYELLYLTWFKKFFNYGRKFTRDNYLIEDCIQEVFLDIWNKRHTSSQISSPNSYYFSSFRYILFRKIKQGTRTLPLAHQEDEPEFCVEQKIIAGEKTGEQQQKLNEALKILTSRQREAIFLRFYEGLSFEEVAVVLNITVKATYKIMARSLATLKDTLTLSLSNLIFLLSISGF